MDDRRGFLKRLLLALGGVGLAGMAQRVPGVGRLAGLRGTAEAAQNDLTWVQGADPYKNTLKALAELGGIGRFVRPGQRVAVLPNIGWARKPEQAGCTHPRVVRALIDECEKAGAKSVTLFCNPCNDARVCLDLSGIGAEVEQTKARFEFINPQGWVERRAVQGCTHLKSTQVYRLVTDSNVLINAAIAKHHGLCELTMCCKNLMGAIKNRVELHQYIHESIADLVLMIPSTLCVLDATRILLRNGPSSGNAADNMLTNTLIAGVNPAQVDVLGTTLFNKKPQAIGYLKTLAQRNYTVLDPTKLPHSRARA